MDVGVWETVQGWALPGTLVSMVHYTISHLLIWIVICIHLGFYSILQTEARKVWSMDDSESDVPADYVPCGSRL